MLGQEPSFADQDMSDEALADALADEMSWVAAGDPLDEEEDSLAEGWAVAQAQHTRTNVQQQQSMAVDRDVGDELTGALQQVTASATFGTSGVAGAGACPCAGHSLLSLQQQQWLWGAGFTLQTAAAARCGGSSTSGSHKVIHQIRTAAVARSLAWVHPG
jgi:hypothetical protein